MEILSAPLPLLFYLGAAVLTAAGTRLGRGNVPAFLGGLLWAAGTVSALVEGAGLDEVLAVTLVLLLISTGFWKRGAGRP